MIEKSQLAGITIAAFAPGASRSELTKQLTILCLAEESPDLLLRTVNLTLFDLNELEAGKVLDFAFSAAELKSHEVFNFLSQQLTYSLLANEFEFADFLVGAASARGISPLQVYFDHWTDHTDKSVQWLQVKGSRIEVFFSARFLGQGWKHLSSPSLVDLLHLVDPVNLEQVILELRKPEQDLCGWLIYLVSLGSIPEIVLNSKVQSLVVARWLSNKVFDDQMTIEVKVFVEGTTLDELSRLFDDAIAYAPGHDVRRLSAGFELIINAKTLVGQSDRDLAFERFGTARKGRFITAGLDSGPKQLSWRVDEVDLTADLKR